MGRATGGMGAKQETEQLDQSYRKRDALQKEIARQSHKIQTQLKNSHRLLIIQACGKEAEQLKKHKPAISYDGRPIDNLAKPTQK